MTTAEIRELEEEEVAEFLGYEDMDQNNPHHWGTVCEHTVDVLKALPETAGKCLVMAALLHDIGKFETRAVNPKTGNDQFLGHAARGVEIIKANMDRLMPAEEYTNSEREYVMELVRLHDTRYGKDRKAQALLDAHEDGFCSDLITLQYADVMGQSKYHRAAKLREVADFCALLEYNGWGNQIGTLHKLWDMIHQEAETAEAELKKAQEEWDAVERLLSSGTYYSMHQEPWLNNGLWDAYRFHSSERPE